MCPACDDDDVIYMVSVQHQTQALQALLTPLSIQGPVHSVFKSLSGRAVIWFLTVG